MQGGAPSCHNLAMTAELRDRRHPSAYVQQVAANVRAECARQGYSASQLGRGCAIMRRRQRRPKLFRVTREERVLVAFYVETTSALKARKTPTPASASRIRAGETVGEASEVYSIPGGEQAIAYSWSTGDYVSTELLERRDS